MVKEVIWTERATLDFRQILEYLYTEWNLKIEEEYYRRVFEVIELLKEFPDMGGVIYERPNSRKILISKFNYLTYMLIGNKLFILSFIDTRMK
ncbi:MAG TPA: type II toxin-antitoxin system RelE/ParE family toxin [Ignavibacteria bacterium]|jgi:plasmid stabilization system protein ParE|nr:type II toxin-antitoxin system RelE/ParE family toxin [Ignavibacteria bacterium]